LADSSRLRFVGCSPDQLSTSEKNFLGTTFLFPSGPLSDRNLVFGGVIGTGVLVATGPDLSAGGVVLIERLP